MPRRNKYWPGAWLACCAVCGRTRYNHELRRGVDGPEQGKPVCRDTCFSPRNPLSDNVRVDRPESRPTWPRTCDCAGDQPTLAQIEAYQRPLTYEELSLWGNTYGETPYGAWGRFDASDQLISIFVPED